MKQEFMMEQKERDYFSNVYNYFKDPAIAKQKLTITGLNLVEDMDLIQRP